MLFNDLVMKLSILTHLLTRLCVSLLGGARPGAGRPKKLSRFPKFDKRITQHETENSDDIEKSNLVQSVDLARKQNDDIQKELNQLNTNIAALSRDVSNKQSIWSQLNAQYAHLVSSTSVLRQQCESAMFCISDLNDVKMRYQSEIERLQQENVSLRAQLDNDNQRLSAVWAIEQKHTTNAEQNKG